MKHSDVRRRFSPKEELSLIRSREPCLKKKHLKKTSSKQSSANFQNSRSPLSLKFFFMRKKFFKTFFQACSDSFSNPLLFWYGFLLFFPITTGYFLVFLFANNSPWVSSPLYTNSIFFFPLTFILSLWGKNKLIL